MAKHGAFQGYIQVNGVDLSDHCTEFDAPLNIADLQGNAMGDTDEYGMPGLNQGDVTATFLQDFAAASVHRTLRPLHNNHTTHPLVWRASSAAAAVANPEYSGDYYVQNYRPIGGAHGAQTFATVTFRRAGNLTNTA